MTSKVASSVKDLLESGAFSDVCVVAGSGTSKKIFDLHRCIICPKSTYFAKALTCGLKESREGIITLPEDEPEDVQRMVQFMYTYKYDLPRKPATGYTKDKDLQTHRAMYKLGDKFLFDDLKEYASELFSKGVADWMKYNGPRRTRRSKALSAYLKDMENFVALTRDVWLSDEEIDKDLRPVLARACTENFDRLKDSTEFMDMMSCELNELAALILARKYVPDYDMDYSSRLTTPSVCERDGSYADSIQEEDEGSIASRVASNGRRRA